MTGREGLSVEGQPLALQPVGGRSLYGEAKVKKFEHVWGTRPGGRGGYPCDEDAGLGVSPCNHDWPMTLWVVVTGWTPILWTDWQTHTTENIIFPELRSLAGSK